MENLLKLLKKYNQIIIFAIIASLVVVTFFIEEMSIALFLFVIFVGTVLKNETLVAIIVFLLPLQVIIAVPIAKMFYLITTFCLFYMLKNYIISIMKKQKIFNWKLFLLATIICLFALAFPTHKNSLENNFVFLVNIIFIIMIYECRKDIGFAKVVEYYSLGIIMSGLIWFFRDTSDIFGIIDRKMIDDFEKFIGCFIHPNIFAFYDMIAISSLYMCFYKKQMPMYKFLLYFIGCFIFGYWTVSRSFLLTFLISTLILYILLLVRDKQKALEFIFPFTAIILILCFMVIDTQTKYYVTRAGEFYEAQYKNKFNQLTSEEWELVLAGKMHFDPGRYGIWLMYILYFIKNPFDFIFGKGNTALRVGKAKAHNFIFDSLNIHGLVGSVLFVLFYYIVFGGKKAKSLKNKDILIMLLPYFIFMLLDPMEFNMVAMIIIALSNIQDNSFKPLDYDNNKMYDKLMINQNKKFKKVQ